MLLAPVYILMRRIYTVPVHTVPMNISIWQSIYPHARFVFNSLLVSVHLGWDPIGGFEGMTRAVPGRAGVLGLLLGLLRLSGVVFERRVGGSVDLLQLGALPPDVRVSVAELK